MKYITFLNRANGNNHTVVRAETKINLRREKHNLFRNPPTNQTTLQNRKPEFEVSIPNKYATLNNEENLGTEQSLENCTKIIKEATVEVGGKNEKENHH